MKRFLNALLVFVLVFTLAVPAMAAPADVKGTEYEDAVAQLTALGVINGYPDGTFRPANDITRAEFAKIVVVATGNESAADILKGTSAFSDVAGDAWYSGYVAAAASFGFVKGYEDGTFRPNNNVTGQEVVTVLLRALGYNDELAGNWPYDYLIKANSLGMLEGLDFTGAAKANRGLVAQLTANTLEQNVVTYNVDTKAFDGEDSVDPDDQFVQAKLGQDFVDAVVTSAALDDEGNIGLNTGTFAFAEGAYVGDWSLGQNVRYLLDDDGAIFYLAEATNDVVTGTLEAELTEAGVVNLVDVDDDYTFAAGAKVFYNTDSLNTADFSVPADASVTLFLDDAGKVRFVIADMFNETNNFFVSYSAATSYRLAKITTDVTYDVVADAKVTKDGKASSLAKLAENDIVDLKLNAAGDVVEVRATTPTNITGEVTSIVDIDGETFYTVGGVKYEALSGVAIVAGTTYDLVLNADKVIVSATVTDDSATQDVIVVSNESVSILVDGVITGVNKVVLFNVSNGETTTYFDDTNLAASVGRYGTVTFTDGDITSFVPNSLDISTTGTPETAVLGTNTLTVTAGTYAVDSSTVFVNLLADVDEDGTVEAGEYSPSFMSFADLQEANAIFYITDGAYTLDLVFVEDGGVAASDAVTPVTGYVTGVGSVTTVDGPTYSATLNVNGASKTLDVAANASANFGKLVRYHDGTTSLGAYDTVVVASALPNGALTVSDNVINGTYLATSSTVVYVVDADGNLMIGDLADVADLDGGTAGTTVDVSVLVAQNLDDNGQPTDGDQTLGGYLLLEAIVITLQ